MRTLQELKLWDGTAPNGCKYDIDPDSQFILYIDAGGTVWYARKDTPDMLDIWCAASRLCYHLHRLEQIKAR